MGQAVTPTSVLDTMLTKDNGYPLDFRTVNVIADSTDGKYFPATIAHIVAIRNMTDVELETNITAYRELQDTRAADWNRRAYSVKELVRALLNIALDEKNRRASFKSGEILLSDYYPDLYIGNVPRVAAPKGKK